MSHRDVPDDPSERPDPADDSVQPVDPDLDAWASATDRPPASPTPPDATGSDGPGAVTPDDLFGVLGKMMGEVEAQMSAHNLDPQHLLQQMLSSPGGQVPPELAGLLAKLGSGSQAGALGALQRQLSSLFSATTPEQRIATAADIARKIVASGQDPSVRPSQQDEVQEAVRLAALWVDPVCEFDAPSARGAAWSASEWVDATMPTWYTLVEPIADGVSRASTQALRNQIDRLGGLEALTGGETPAVMGMPLGELFAQVGPALEQVGRSLFTAQVGQAVGTLGADLLTGTEVGLPLVAGDDVVLLPHALEEFARGLEVDAQQLRIYLAVRESARARLFASVPWLGPRLESAVRDFGRHITIDTDAIESALGSVDLGAGGMPDMERLQEAFGTAEKFARATTPEQQVAVTRLETTLALVEGWVDLVTEQATAPLPQAASLGEAIRRRRASGGPAERAFAGLVGLEFRPRRLRDARNLWAALENAGGTRLRDGSWEYPDLAPTPADLDDPLGYVERRTRGPVVDALDAELDKLLSDAGPDPQDGQPPGDDAS